MKNYLWGSIAVMIAAILWAVDGEFLSPTLGHINIVVVVFIFHILPFIFMAIPLYIERAELKKLDAKDWVAFLAVAAFGGALGTIAFVSALFTLFASQAYSPVSIIFLLQKLQPIFAIALALVILREKPRPSYYFLAATALIGSYLLTFGFGEPDFGSSEPIVRAAIYALIAAFAWGAGTALSKRALQKVNFRVGTYLRFGLTSAMLLLVIIAFNLFGKFSAITPADWGIFFLIAFTTGGTAIFIYYWGLKRINATISTMCELMLPITAIVIDYFRDQLLSAVQWLGAAILLGSVVAVTVEQRRIIENHPLGKNKKR